MERLWYLIPLVLLIVLIFGGANKLPEIGAGMGRAIREFRSAMSGGPDPSAPGTTPRGGRPDGWIRRHPAVGARARDPAGRDAPGLNPAPDDGAAPPRRRGDRRAMRGA